MTRCAFDSYEFDARQTAAEEAHADYLAGRDLFACEGCHEEHDIAERVVFSRHPEMPSYCWVCASSPSPGGRTYP